MSQFNPFEESPQKNGGNSSPKLPPSPALRAFLFSLCAVLLTGFASLFVLFNAPSFSDVPTNSSSSVAENPQNPSSGTDPSPSLPSENPNAPVLSLSPVPDTAPLTDQEIVQKVRASIVSVMVYESYLPWDGAIATQLGVGSGIIMSEDGYIVTNSHVIDNRKDVYVRIVLFDGKELRAQVVGCDARTDLAVLKVNPDGISLVAAEFADSESCTVGDPVLAFGNPGGVAYANSVTKGILSATNRFISLEINTLPLFQTDAAINPGNSGGALVNCYGQVIGINSAKISGTSYEGMGFAIPTLNAKPVIDQLSCYGQIVNRVWLGINFSVVSQLDASFYQIKPGAQITYLAPNSIFSNTGVKEGDIITAIGGVSFSSAIDFFALLNEYRPGDWVQIEIYRPKEGRTPAESFSVSVQFQADPS